MFEHLNMDNDNKNKIMLNSDDTYYLEEDEIIGICYFSKDNLYKSYNNVSEIIEEIYNYLKDDDFEVDKEFIKARLGLVSGVSIG